MQFANPWDSGAQQFSCLHQCGMWFSITILFQGVIHLAPQQFLTTKLKGPRGNSVWVTTQTPEGWSARYFCY